jgi:hypothetical protein
MLKNYKFIPFLGAIAAVVLFSSYFWVSEPNKDPLSTIFAPNNYADISYILAASSISIFMGSIAIYRSLRMNTKDSASLNKSELVFIFGLMSTLCGIIFGSVSVSTTATCNIERNQEVALLSEILQTKFEVSIYRGVNLATPAQITETGSLFGQPYTITERRKEITLSIEEGKRLEEYLKEHKLAEHTLFQEALVLAKVN